MRSLGKVLEETERAAAQVDPPYSEENKCFEAFVFPTGLIKRPQISYRTFVNHRELCFFFLAFC